MTIQEAQLLHTPNMTPGQQVFAGCMYFVLTLVLFRYMLTIDWSPARCKSCGGQLKYGWSFIPTCVDNCSKVGSKTDVLVGRNN